MRNTGRISGTLSGFPNQLRDILEITSNELGIVLDERTLHYERFVTHLKFLLQRVYRRELLPDEEDELAELMRTEISEGVPRAAVDCGIYREKYRMQAFKRGSHVSGYPYQKSDYGRNEE